MATESSGTPQLASAFETVLSRCTEGPIPLHGVKAIKAALQSSSNKRLRGVVPQTSPWSDHWPLMHTHPYADLTEQHTLAWGTVALEDTATNSGFDLLRLITQGHTSTTWEPVIRTDGIYVARERSSAESLIPFTIQHGVHAEREAIIMEGQMALNALDQITRAAQFFEG